jgi:hypothetical protein
LAIGIRTNVDSLAGIGNSLSWISEYDIPDNDDGKMVTLCRSNSRGAERLTDAPNVRAILAHLGEHTAQPRIAPAHGPPLKELNQGGKPPPPGAG